MQWTRTTEPTTEPIDLDTAKRHCRIDGSDEDGLIAALISAARSACESYTGLSLPAQAWTVTLDDWFDVVSLPHGPVTAVSAVRYRASDGTLTTVSSTQYLLDTSGRVARVLRAPNVTWPVLQADRLSRVEIAYATGYATVPVALVQGMLLLIGHWHENREAVNIGNITSALPFATEALWAPWRVWTPTPALVA